MLQRFLKNETGATAIEYAFLASLIAIACLVAVKLVGANVLGMYNNVAGNVNSAMSQ